MQQEKGWILATRTDLQPAYAQNKTLIDSLTQAGLTFHYFEPPFATATIENALKAGPDTAVYYQDYWALLRALNQHVPTDLPLYLFTNNLLKNFRGQRPAVALQLNWQTFNYKDTTATFVADAYTSGREFARISTAKSTPTATTISIADRPIASLADSFTLTAVSNPGNAAARQNVGRTQLDTSTLHCVIYSSAYPKDAAYVQAALQAIAAYGKRRIEVQVANKTSELPANHDWLFWLAEQPVPVQHQLNNVVYYATGKVLTQSSGIYTNNTAAQGIPLHRRIAETMDRNTGIPVWIDGFGDNILSLQQGSANLYKFNSRFNPMWNDLAWNKAFPAIVLELLYGPGTTTIHPADIRRIDAAQMLPGKQESTTIKKAKFTRTVHLAQALWLLAFVLFCVERYLSLTNKKEVVHE